VARPGKNSAHSVDEWLIRPTDSPSDEPELDENPEDFILDEAQSQETQADDRAIGTEASQWLVGAPAGRNGGSTEVQEAAPRDDRKAREPAAEDAPDAELENAERALVQQKTRVGELELTLRQRERELSEVQVERDAALKEREAAFRERLSKSYEKRKADLEEGFDQRQAALETQLEEVEDRLDVREAELRQRATQREAELQSRIEELESALTEAQQRAIAKPAPRRSVRKKGKLDLNEATFEQLRDLGISVTLSARVISYRDSRGGFDSIEELDEIPGLSAEFKRVLRDQLKLG
jgi:DNA uptake protein ComE-like DNA-binding protein